MRNLKFGANCPPALGVSSQWQPTCRTSLFVLANLLVAMNASHLKRFMLHVTSYKYILRNYYYNLSKPVVFQPFEPHWVSSCEKMYQGPRAELLSWMMWVHSDLKRGLKCCELMNHYLSSSSLTHGILKMKYKNVITVISKKQATGI